MYRIYIDNDSANPHIVYMPGKSSRDKGGRVERELVNKLKDAGLQALRVPLSGAADGFKGDINIHMSLEETLVAEVKARKDGTGFKQLEDWKGDHDYLFLKRNNRDPMVAMDWDHFVSLLQSYQQALKRLGLD